MESDKRAGMESVSKKVLEYVQNLHVEQDTSLQQALDAPMKYGLPPIHVAPSEGKFIALLLAMHGAKKVVEVGTLAGYSTIHIARALPHDGHVWTFEFNPKCAEVARENLKAAKLENKVTLIEGAAIEMLPRIEKEGPFDAVFIDADKPNYPKYGEWAAKNTRPGGLLLGDNSFAFGRLTDDEKTTTDLTVLGKVYSAKMMAALAASMRVFHENAKKSYNTVNIPTPEGLLLGIKK